jgi:nicotinate-nucleotide adenylyltransferase
MRHYYNYQATQIRKYIKEGKSVRYMVPDKVLEEIEKGSYYKR